MRECMNLFLHFGGHLNFCIIIMNNSGGVHQLLPSNTLNVFLKTARFFPRLPQIIGGLQRKEHNRVVRVLEALATPGVKISSTSVWACEKFQSKSSSHESWHHIQKQITCCRYDERLVLEWTLLEKRLQSKCRTKVCLITKRDDV